MTYPREHIDATAQAELVRAGHASARELVESALQRIESRNGAINAVVHLDAERALRDADAPLSGPFAGVPILLKDLGVTLAGDPDHQGSAVRRRAGLTAAVDSSVVTRLRRAGFIPLGRTNTAELGLYSETSNAAYGATANPWDQTRSAGGSSGGSAAAVSAGMTAVAQGTDGGGSIRNPAAHTGLVGLKVSRGLISAAPGGESMFGHSQIGVLTTTTRDTAAITDVLTGVETGDPVVAPNIHKVFANEMLRGRTGLRIGLLDHDPGGLWPVDPAIRDAVQETGRVLEGLGHHVEIAWPEAMFDSRYAENWFAALSPFAALWRDAALAEAGGEPDFNVITEYWADRGREMTSTAHLRALMWLDDLRRRIAAWWTSGFDVLLCPVIPVQPRPLGAFWDRPSGLQDSISILRFTPQFNTTGQPAISVPAGIADGLPVGVQLVGAYGTDGMLLDLAHQLETARPWPHLAPAYR